MASSRPKKKTDAFAKAPASDGDRRNGKAWKNHPKSNPKPRVRHTPVRLPKKVVKEEGIPADTHRRSSGGRVVTSDKHWLTPQRRARVLTDLFGSER